MVARMWMGRWMRKGGGTIEELDGELAASSGGHLGEPAHHAVVAAILGPVGLGTGRVDVPCGPVHLVGKGRGADVGGRTEWDLAQMEMLNETEREGRGGEGGGREDEWKGGGVLDGITRSY